MKMEDEKLKQDMVSGMIAAGIPRLEAEIDAARVECCYHVGHAVEVLLEDSEKYSSKTFAAIGMAMGIVAFILKETKHLDEDMQDFFFRTIMCKTKIGEYFDAFFDEADAINRAANEKARKDKEKN